MTNLVVTYILWLFGGILGLHHVYLNRPRHCFIWCVTWGGMVLGWLSEVVQIKGYVDEANETSEFKKRMKEIKKEHKTPELTVGFLGFSMLIGNQLANITVSSVPDSYIVDTWYGPYLAHVLAALGTSVGVYLVANMGQQKAPFWLPFLAAACTCPSSYFLYHRRPVINIICVMAAGYVSSEFSEWDSKKKPKSTVDYVKMWSAVVAGLLVYATMWSSNLYHNHRVSSLNGTRIPLREAFANFAKTQPWDESREAMWDLVPCLKMYPYDTCVNLFIGRLTELSDPEKDGWALGVLGFERFPSEKEVNTHCRKMSKKYHPDRMRKKPKEEQEEAEKIFIDVQKACRTLSKLKMNRERQSTWPENMQQETVVNNGDALDDINYNEHNSEDTIDDDDHDNSDFGEDYCDDNECRNDISQNINNDKHAQFQGDVDKTDVDQRDEHEVDDCDALSSKDKCDDEECLKEGV